MPAIENSNFCYYNGWWKLAGSDEGLLKYIFSSDLYWNNYTCLISLHIATSSAGLEVMGRRKHVCCVEHLIAIIAVTQKGIIVTRNARVKDSKDIRGSVLVQNP